MARVKRGVTAHAKHKKVLKKAKGYYGRRKNTIRIAKQAVEKAMQYAYRDRKRKKRTFRALWIQRINAAVREHGLTYGRFIDGLAQGRDRDRPQGAGGSRREGRRRLQGARRPGGGPARRRRDPSSRNSRERISGTQGPQRLAVLRQAQDEVAFARGTAAPVVSLSNHGNAEADLGEFCSHQANG